MKEGWEVKKLGDVCELSAGGDVPKNAFSEIKTEVFNVPIYANGEKNIGLYGYTNIPKIKKPSITISARGTIGFAVKRLESFYPIVRLIVITPKENLDLSYLYHVVTNIDFKHSGTSIPQLTVPMIKDYEIPIPSLTEQKRIVAILDQAFEAIAKAKANAEQNLKNAKSLFESYLNEVFENKGDGWEETILEREIDLITGFAFKSKNYTNNVDDILLIRGDNIMQGFFRWEDVKRWNKDEYSEYSKYELFENDILLAMDRPWVKSGLKCVRVSKRELPALLVQRTACLRNKKSIDNTFLYYVIKSQDFMKYLIDVQSGIGVPHISGKQILSFSFSKPKSIKQQTQIVEKLDKLRAETQKLEAIYKQKLEDLEELKKSILQKAFAGELKTEIVV